MSITPYLFFEGRCEEAIAFYEKAIGARVVIKMRFGDAPPGAPAEPANADRIMHATLAVAGGELLVSDGNCVGAPGFAGFGVALATADEAQAARWFDALADGGATRLPLVRTFFAKSFGMCTDRFGVLWLVTVPA